ncbi:MAG: hypothetical protein AAF742_00050 [Pseudomonadota bacterium]
MPKDTSAHVPVVIDAPKHPQIFFGDDGQKCGHLFAAVIEQAFRELFIPQSGHDGDKEYSRHESIRFFTADHGEWAAHRNWLCTCANINGDALAHAVREMLLGNQPIALNIGQRRDDEVGLLSFKQHQIDQARAVYADMLRQESARRSKTPPAKLPRIVEPAQPAVVIKISPDPFAPPPEVILPDDELPLTAAEARRIGSKFYLTGKPCKHGHVAKRRASTSSCMECEDLSQKAYAAKVRASK